MARVVSKTAELSLLSTAGDCHGRQFVNVP